MTRRHVVIFDQPIAHCPLCGQRAICQLPPALLAQQPDDTTLVCHPGYGGCNTGFLEDGGIARLPEKTARCGVCAAPVSLDGRGMVTRHDDPGDANEFEWCPGTGQVPEHR